MSFEASAVTGSPEDKDGDPEDTKDDGVGSEDVKGDGGGCLFCAGDDNEIPGRACEAGRRDDDAWGRLSRSDHCDQGAAAPRRSVSRVTSTIVDVPTSMLRRVYAIRRVCGWGARASHESRPCASGFNPENRGLERTNVVEIYGKNKHQHGA